VCQKRLGLPSSRVVKKPLLTEKMVRKRLMFCRKHHDWTEEEWETRMFSDESLFRLINLRAQKVRLPTAMNCYKRKYMVKNVKHSASVMIWGCFSGKGGKGSLYFLPPKATMNGEHYMRVLEEKLIPWMGFHSATKFLKEEASCHSTKMMMALLKEKNIAVMDWLGNSQDLNPIENVWSIMKAKPKRDPSISSLPLLIRAIKMIWVKDLPVTLFKKLTHSMPKRMRMYIKNKGQMTKY
jgi:hypothetical protein